MKSRFAIALAVIAVALVAALLESPSPVVAQTKNARAWVYNVEPRVAGVGQLDLHIEFLFVGANTSFGGGGRSFDMSKAVITVAAGDTLTDVRTKITDAVIASATANGYTVARTAIVLPAWQTGQ